MRRGAWGDWWCARWRVRARARRWQDPRETPAAPPFEGGAGLRHPRSQPVVERERKLLQLRFGAEMTQADTGKELNLSQMHISRLLNRACKKLREGLLAES
ncbi:sigma-70 family RNA polymerase sigma factor [Streptomyces sp. NPDC001739]